MRKLAARLAVGLAAVGLAGSAFAQPRPDLDSLFARADLNHDGVVSRAEFQASRAERFQDLDRNHDGFLTPEDFPQFIRWSRSGDQRMTRFIEQFDADHDGKVSEAEFVAGSMRLFDQADANHDGAVDRAEATDAAARIRAAMSR